MSLNSSTSNHPNAAVRSNGGDEAVRLLSASPDLGRDSIGRPVVTPTSVFTAQRGDRVFQSIASSNIEFMMCPLWSRVVEGVALPVAALFEHVPMQPAMLRHWVAAPAVGSLIYPRRPNEVNRVDPLLLIRKQHSGGDPSSSASLPGPSGVIRANLTLHFFRREVAASDALQPFEEQEGPGPAASWDSPDMYALWRDLYESFAPVVAEEYTAAQGGDTGETCRYFRRVMRTHFEDFGLVFGKTVWSVFGFGAAANSNAAEVSASPDAREFMREAMLCLFIAYKHCAPPPVPPQAGTLFNPRPLAQGQHACAQCFTVMLGSGQMRRCPCHQVYYCGKACQVAHWGVHKLLCTHPRPARGAAAAASGAAE